MKTFKSFITEAPIGKVKKGQMHKDLGKSPDAKITSSDIAKEKSKGGVFAKRAVFAQNAKKWHHEGVDMTDAYAEVLASEEVTEPVDPLSEVKVPGTNRHVAVGSAERKLQDNVAKKKKEKPFRDAAATGKARDFKNEETELVDEANKLITPKEFHDRGTKRWKEILAKKNSKKEKPFRDAAATDSKRDFANEEMIDELSKKTLDEKLAANASAGDTIDDFVHSKNKMFSGDSKKQRIKRALGAYYGKKNEEKEETIVEEHDMSDAAHELVNHADNHAQLHHGSHMPIINNLKKKMKKGSYDPEKAKKLWGYHADRAAQSYHKEYGDKATPWHKMFTTHDRKQAASHWEAHHREELKESVDLTEAKPKVHASWYASGGHRTDPALVAKFAAQRKEKKQFASAKREIDRLKKQGK